MIRQKTKTISLKLSGIENANDMKQEDLMSPMTMDQSDNGSEFFASARSVITQNENDGQFIYKKKKTKKFPKKIKLKVNNQRISSDDDELSDKMI